MPIERKYERDIDLLLAEEFAVNSAFTQEFLGRTGFRGEAATVVDWFVSRSDRDGESDVVVVFAPEGGGSRFALLVEDKVDANLQPMQAERYRLRAERDHRVGLYDRFETVLCAPRFYVDARSDLTGFDCVISFEEIAAILRRGNDARSAYRASFLETAASRRVNAWVREEDDTTNDFWTAAYQMASRDFVELEMKPLSLTKGSSWINFRPQDFPTKPGRVYISFKGDKGHIDLTIERVSVTEAAPILRPLLEHDMTLHRTGQSTAVRLAVGQLRVLEGFASQADRVRSAFEASLRLIRFFRANRAPIDDLRRP